MPQRRDFLKLAVAGAIGGVGSKLNGIAVAAETWPAHPVNAPMAFGPQTVLDLARTLVKKPFKAPEAPMPDAFVNLTYEQYAQIQPKPTAAIWSGDSVGFTIEPLHRGFIFTAPMDIF